MGKRWTKPLKHKKFNYHCQHFLTN